MPAFTAYGRGNARRNTQRRALPRLIGQMG